LDLFPDNLRISRIKPRPGTCFKEINLLASGPFLITLMGNFELILRGQYTLKQIPEKMVKNIDKLKFGLIV
jgi:hypothetical protein